MELAAVGAREDDYELRDLSMSGRGAWEVSAEAYVSQRSDGHRLVLNLDGDAGPFAPLRID